jgi:lactam utilization protein B
MVKGTINCDMGEAFGIYPFGDDEACMPFITHANIACGFHASDPVVMRQTMRAAKRHCLAVHSDTPNAVEVARAVRQTLARQLFDFDRPLLSPSQS